MAWFKTRRRKSMMKRPLPLLWHSTLRRCVPYFGLLPSEDQREMEGLIQVLLAEKHFEGCGGLEITDEIRVTIAGFASILLLHRETDFYPTLHSILVYPDAYVAPATHHQPDGTVFEGPEVRSGESWYRGCVVLSWDDVRGSRRHHGRNIVLHEFTHQLDDESWESDGVPLLLDLSLVSEWLQVFEREFNRLVDDVDQHRRTFPGSLRGQSPAEFFAVATESFFEIPIQLQAQTS